MSAAVVAQFAGPSWRTAATVVLALMVAACAEPVTYPDWTIPVPEGARVVEYPYVAEEDRTASIELTEDLVIASGAQPFYRLIDVDVDSDGNIYAFDIGNSNIVAFDRAGTYLRTIGREGQGPGEIEGGGRIAVVGSSIVHVGDNRLNVWAPDGEVLGSRAVEFTRFLLPIAGTDDGRFLAGYRQFRDDGETSDMLVVGVSLEGERGREYVRLPVADWVDLLRTSGSRVSYVNTRIPTPEATFVMSRDGQVYATAGDEYQLLAIAPDGRVRWALRTSKQRPPLTDERIEAALERLARPDNDGDPGMMPPPQRSEVDWPATLPALIGNSFVHASLQSIRVDGHGHLYVYPFIPDSWDRPDQPVDVYAPDGAHLFSGMMPIMRWEAARGDFIYAVGTDPETEEYRIERYRLIEPF